MRRVLVDTGPLVAILSPDDADHELCVKELHRLPTPLFSCWPVITEAAWLLRGSPHAVRQLLGSIDGGVLSLLPLAGAEGAPIAALMKKYEDLSPQLADAALVYLAGRERIKTVFTLDRRDFSVYRGNRRHAFTIVPEL
jgi:uncharacterized protein